jgi:hypothetical protein
MTKGQILYLPPYWWYSIEFGQEASVCSFKYKTYMNTVSILPQLVMKVLQTQNVKRNHMEKMKMVAVKEEIPKGDALSNPTSSGIAPTSSGIAPTVSIMGSSIDIMPTILEEPSSYSSIQSTEINNLPL